MVMGSASKAVLSTRVGNGSIPYSSSKFDNRLIDGYPKQHKWVRLPPSE